ncbi:MAG: hypothetical protein ACFCUR_16920 [Rhodomicrobiaceae bacterium]
MAVLALKGAAERKQVCQQYAANEQKRQDHIDRRPESRALEQSRKGWRQHHARSKLEQEQHESNSRKMSGLAYIVMKKAAQCRDRSVRNAAISRNAAEFTL